MKNLMKLIKILAVVPTLYTTLHVGCKRRIVSAMYISRNTHTHTHTHTHLQAKFKRYCHVTR